MKFEYTEEYCELEIGHDFESTGFSERLDTYNYFYESQCLNCGKTITIVESVPNEQLEAEGIEFIA